MVMMPPHSRSQATGVADRQREEAQGRWRASGSRASMRPRSDFEQGAGKPVRNKEAMRIRGRGYQEEIKKVEGGKTAHSAKRAGASLLLWLLGRRGLFLGVRRLLGGGRGRRFGCRGRGLPDRHRNAEQPPLALDGRVCRHVRRIAARARSSGTLGARSARISESGPIESIAGAPAPVAGRVPMSGAVISAPGRPVSRPQPE